MWGTTCAAKTCADYTGRDVGYDDDIPLRPYRDSSLINTVCNNTAKVYLGDESAICYAGCVSCEELTPPSSYIESSFSPDKACDYGNFWEPGSGAQSVPCLHADPGFKVSGYPYGTCTLYQAKCWGALPCGDCNMCCSEHASDNPEICQILGGGESDLLPGWGD